GNRMKSPSFPCYVNNLLGSGRIASMSNAEFGAYWMLLCRAWNEDDCGLPDDDEVLAAWSRCYGDWPKHKAKILRCFRAENGRLYNDKLRSCRKQQEDYRKSCSEAGKVGSSRRWGGHSHPITTP
ncbi:MAG: DUF1376 domain-containing protein, partial [bacterium]